MNCNCCFKLSVLFCFGKYINIFVVEWISSIEQGVELKSFSGLYSSPFLLSDILNSKDSAWIYHRDGWHFCAEVVLTILEVNEHQSPNVSVPVSLWWILGWPTEVEPFLQIGSCIQYSNRLLQFVAYLIWTQIKKNSDFWGALFIVLIGWKYIHFKNNEKIVTI